MRNKIIHSASFSELIQQDHKWGGQSLAAEISFHEELF